MFSEEPIDDNEPVPDWHWEILQERLARYELDGMNGIPLEELEKELFELLAKPPKD